MDSQLKTSRKIGRRVSRASNDNNINDLRELTNFIHDRLTLSDHVKTPEEYDKLAEVILSMVKIKYGKQIAKNSLLINYTKCVLTELRRKAFLN